jgi:hypothetical protein
MVQGRLIKISILGLMAILIISFSEKQFAFDGGTINNPDIVVIGNSSSPEITATTASGCPGSVTYQWQQSFDGNNFIDVPNATSVSYQPGTIMAKTQFRRRAICGGTDTAYTNNVATVTIQ